jgi:hypothetical protein
MHDNSWVGPIYPRAYGWLNSITDKKELYGALRWLGRTDLYFLCKFILGMRDLETQTSIHYGLCQALEKEETRTLILMSRDTFKTSVAVGRVVQWVLNNPNVEVGMGSDKLERAEKRTIMVKDTFEHCTPLKYLYPDVCFKEPLLESDLWTTTAFNVKRAKYAGGTRVATVTSFGFFPLPTGAHFDKALIDDLENEANTNTDDLVLQLNQRLVAFMPVLKANGQLVMVGTIYHASGPNRAYSTLWPTYKVPIVDGHGVPTFPSRFPLEAIFKKREEIIKVGGPYTWHTQYLLQPHARDHNYSYPLRDVVLKSFHLTRAD